MDIAHLKYKNLKFKSNETNGLNLIYNDVKKYAEC